MRENGDAGIGPIPEEFRVRQPRRQHPLVVLPRLNFSFLAEKAWGGTTIGAVVGGALLGFFVEGTPGFGIAVLTALAGAFVVVVGGRLVVARLSA